MKMTTHIDERLLKHAMRVTRARTKREALERGLQAVIDEAKHHEFVREFRTFRLTWSRDALRRSRA